MNRSRPRGITLTEILIAILLLGVGVTSIMTLFPLGLLNVRAATRLSRSAFLVESAGSDMGTRGLLSKGSFAGNLVTAPWHMPPMAIRAYDPWLQDTPAYGTDPWVAPFGAYRGDGPPASAGNTIGPILGAGLPVAYDPLWRSTTGIYPDPKTGAETRFASGLGFVRNDPDGGAPSAHGLQRITNFPSWSPTNVPDIFVSPEDMVLQSDTDASKGAGALSPIVPDLSLSTNAMTGLATATNDWKYTWMFTGQQAYVADTTVYVGDVVVFENRPFAYDPVSPPVTTKPAVTHAVAGETVVEAIFGYTNNPTIGLNSLGYGTKSPRSVLLRWPAAVVDPEIRVGNWIADVTYERVATIDVRRKVTDGAKGGAIYPYQRCHWYQIAKRTQAEPSPTLAGYREMTVWTSAPLQAFTLLDASDPTNVVPAHVNAALVSPYVVNVFPQTIYVR